MKRLLRQSGAALLFLAAYGCAIRPPAPQDTGARAAVQTYFDALLRQDWPRAYETLHPDCRARFTLTHFTRLARGHRQGLGFEPVAVHIRFCEEQGEQATVHPVLTGSTGAKARQYKDALVLRNGAKGWGVVLPPRFGPSRR